MKPSKHIIAEVEEGTSGLTTIGRGLSTTMWSRMGLESCLLVLVLVEANSVKCYL